jgi:predicted HTH domain antitoxin
MTTLKLECPDELMTALGKRPDDATREIRLMAALKLYESARLSSGMAAQLADMSRVEFLLACGQHGVTVFQQTDDELKSDLDNALHARRR